MKLIPLPEGMVVKRKLHLGKKWYKMKLYQGYIRSLDNEKIDLQVGREVGHQFVAINIALDNSFPCTCCNGNHGYEIELVMN